MGKNGLATLFRHDFRLLATALILATPVALAAGTAGASTPRASPRSQARSLVVRASHPVPPGVTPRAPGNHPLLEPDPAAYVAQKRAADAAAARLAGRAAPRAPGGPSVLRNWAGQRDTTLTPSDSTGAIGTSRYIELVNAKAAVYSRTSNTPTASAPLLNLTGCVTTACTDQVFDPQVIWDPGTKRFFFAADDAVSNSKNFLSVGFSTTATPTLSASSWCRYHLSFGATLPDYPKLGDTKDFQLIGVNAFNGVTITSVIAWMSKPKPGTTCPAASALKAGTSATLKNPGGSKAFTPVPANQTDTSSTGWAVARPATIPPGGATFLTVFKVTKSASGTATIPATGTKVPVAAYKMPAAARQKGTKGTIDTLDGRNTQAVSAVDPAHGNVTALWTQHAVFGGAGSQERWYEINPAARSVIQHGTVTSPASFIFDGAVSPDRRVNGSSAEFGADMVIDVVTSSSSTLPTIKAASKIGTHAISGFSRIATSSAAENSFGCARGNVPCRWGDYAAATPDPASPASGTAGEVWGSSMLAAGGTASSAGWVTRNFAIRP